MAQMTRESVQASVDAIQERLNRASNEGDNWLYYEGDEWSRQSCTWYLLSAWVLLVDLIARLDHGPLLDFANEEYEKCKKDPTDSEMSPHDEPVLVWPRHAFRLLRMVQDLHLYEDTKVPDPKSVSHLLSIIRRSEYYVTSRSAFGWLPCREEDLHQRLEGLIKCSYPDLLTKPQLSKPIKGFIPDSSVPSLRTLLEYKFIGTQAESKAVLDQVYADISGYQSDEYDTFIFVIYETSRVTQETDWDAAVSASNPRSRIETVVIRGNPPNDYDSKTSKEVQTRRRASKPRAEKQ